MSTLSGHGGTNIPPPISNYLVNFFLQASLNIFELENKKQVHEIRTLDLARHRLKTYPLHHKRLYQLMHGVLVI